MLLLLVLCLSIKAQIQVTSGDVNPFTPQNLISNVLLGKGVEIKSIRYDGSDKSVGYFTNGNYDIGLSRGVVMSTGLAVSAASPNSVGDMGSTTTSGQLSSSETDLSALTSTVLRDIARYVITFVPSSDTLRFDYVFASEEYPEFVCSEYNDVFGFFITGPNPSGGMYNAINIAKIPKPSGDGYTNFPVAINTVNGGMSGEDTQGNCNNPLESLGFNQFYNDNSGSQTFTFDGFIDVFRAEALVVPCQEYTIKLAIADGKDTNFDSAVFLGAKSFSSGSLNANVTTFSQDGSLAEACMPGSIKFSLPYALAHDFIIDFNIITDPALGSIAIEGVDYTDIPDQIIIPKGQKEVKINIDAFEDNVVEGVEYIYVEYRSNSCQIDTFKIPIRDNILQDVMVTQDTFLCSQDNITLEASFSTDFDPPPTLRFYYNGESPVLGDIQAINNMPFSQPSFLHSIEVNGVIPERLNAQTIEKICIDTFVVLARDITIYDFYLIGPDGQILELMTDIGDGLDDNSVPPIGPDVDTIFNLCFAPVANQNVNNGNGVLGPFFNNNPTYTGEFLPEGTWNDIWADGKYASNGIYSILMTLDENPLPYGLTNNINRLLSWSIHFTNVYDYQYQWSSDDGSISCANCPSIDITPVQNQAYYLKLTDSYGCQVVDTTRVEIFDLPAELPMLNCSILSNSELEFIWGSVNIGEVQIMIDNSGEWLPTFQNSIRFTGLSFNESKTISIKVINGECESEIISATCFTPDCALPTVSIEDISLPICYNGSDGSIDLVAEGTVGPYTFVLNGNSNQTGFFDNLSSGNYIVNVADQSGCSLDFEVELPSGPSAITQGIIINPISCTGALDASVTVDIAGDLGPFQYIWSDGTTDSILSNIGSGLYPVTISDINGCFYLDTVMVVDPMNLSIKELLIKNETCFDYADGEVKVIVEGGTEPYFYSLDGGVNYFLLEEINNLAIGNYDLIVKDNGDCETVSNFTIEGTPEPLQASVELINQVCYGDNTGQAMVNILGGKPDYQIRWSDNSMGSTINAVGDIGVTITDGNNCELIIESYIEPAEEIDLNYNIIPISCFGDQNAVVIFDPKGGQGNINLSYSNIGEGIFNQNIVNDSLKNLSEGTYEILAIDENNCSNTVSLELIEPDQIMITAEKINTGCTGMSTGSIQLFTTGNQGVTNYQWTGTSVSDPFMKNQIGLDIGQYSVTITDENLCSETANFDIGVATQLSYDYSQENVNCKFDATGQLIFNTTSGMAPFRYSLIGSNGYYRIDSIHNSIQAGEYYLELKDAESCILRDTIVIIEPEEGLTAQFDAIDKICYNSGAIATASVTAHGGTMPYQYLWENGSTDVIANGLSAGFHKVLITDAKQCTRLDSIEILTQDSIVMSLNIVNPSCNEFQDGQVNIIDVRQGNQNINIDELIVEWGHTNDATSTLIGLQAGVLYNVTVTDALGCTGEQQFELIDPELLSIELLNVNEITCYNESNGSILVSGVGGTSPYNIMWDANTNFQTGNEAINLVSGTYNVTISDIFGCVASMSTFLAQPTPITSSTQSQDVICHGENNGYIELNTTGASLPYRYMWNTGDTIAKIDDLEAGIYTVVISDANNCQFFDTIEINQPLEVISINATTYNNECEGASAGGIIVEATGGNGHYRYSIDGEEFFNNPEIVALSQGIYDVYVIDQKSCMDTLFNVIIEEPLSIITDLGPDQFVEYNQSLILNPNIGNPNEDLIYDWVINGNAQVVCNVCPILELDSIQSDLTIQVFVYDSYGCSSSDLIFIDLVKDAFVDVPTGFTPNNDGENDILIVFGKSNLIINEFSIFDKWGEEVYHLNNFNINDTNIGWNGMFKNKQSPPGVYAWKARVRLEDGSVEQFSGSTTLIR